MHPHLALQIMELRQAELDRAAQRWHRLHPPPAPPPPPDHDEHRPWGLADRWRIRRRLRGTRLVPRRAA